ncbi:YkuS family protein [Ammoniphilus resinae]|uniref:Uncharacterized protein n=1 Tax=Ammoniphilus resinae TaxID=861532 RepID=A0ABS4GV18_9BACL|nr:YkuS family protein [Ammoniphilus resinae]MBP1934103.1 hypothetical protein [Ammoniphilus resinae]
MARIGVEATLSDVKQQLQNSGHEVVDLEAENAQQCDACVISGQDKDVMGMADVATNSSVINAQGMTPQEVVEQVNRSFS